MKQEIRDRFNIIFNVLKNENKSYINYFESLKDIEDVNLLYFDSINSKKTEKFIDSLKIDKSTKIDLIIEMISRNEYTNYVKGKPDKNNLFFSHSNVPFLGMSEKSDVLSASMFFRRTENRKIVLTTIENRLERLLHKISYTKEEEQELEKLKKAKQAFQTYEIMNTSNNAKRLEIFINMMAQDKYTNYVKGKPDKMNIFKVESKVPFDGVDEKYGLYIGQFWHSYSNSEKIKYIIETRLKDLLNKTVLTKEEEQELEKLKKAKQAFQTYEIMNSANNTKRLEIFINMMAQDKYTNYVKGKPDKMNIFTQLNKVPFDGVEAKYGLVTGYFWNDFQDDIKQKIDDVINTLLNKDYLSVEETEKLRIYKKAKKAYITFETLNWGDPTLRDELFINMMAQDKYTSYNNGAPDENNIFASFNSVPFIEVDEKYGLTTKYYYSKPEYKQRIIAKIEKKIELLSNKRLLTLEEAKELETYRKAKHSYQMYEIVNKQGLINRIKLFVEMMAQDEYTNYVNGKPDSKNIFSSRNKTLLIGVDEKIGLVANSLWGNSKKEIVSYIDDQIQLLSEKDSLTNNEVSELEKLKKAKHAYETYEILNPNNTKQRTRIFIDMLLNDEYTNYVNDKPDGKNIFVTNNRVPFLGIDEKYGATTHEFWRLNKILTIIPTLFFSQEYDNSLYDIAREKIMYNLNRYQRKNELPEFNNIYEYILTLDVTKKEVKKLIKVRDEYFARKQALIEENEKLKQDNGARRIA